MRRFLQENKEWVFSGVGVFLMTVVYNLLRDGGLSPYSMLIGALSWAFIYFIWKTKLLIFFSCKIIEFLNFFMEPRSKIAPERILFNCHSFKKYHYDVINYLNEFVCSNQGKIPQFNYNVQKGIKILKFRCVKNL